ncbi:hypothetical protein ACB311_27810 [Klebsiella pneumoniae]
MRLIYTLTGLNNPLLPVYSQTAAEKAISELSPSVWTPVKTEFLKMGSGAKVVAISNRLDGGLFKSLETLEPSTKLNGSVLQGLNFSGASGMAGDTAVVMDANINTFAFIYQLPGGALPATPQDRAVIATQESNPSWRRHSYNVSRFIPDFSEWRDRGRSGIYS